MTQVAKVEPEIIESRSLTPIELLDRAITLNATPDTMEKLIALQERHDANVARKAFDEAMAKAKSEIPVIKKNRTVDFVGKTGIRTNYKHEDMAEVARTIDPILAKHGLSYRYRTTSEPNAPVTVTCIISHRLGHSEQTTLSAGRDETGNKNSIQAVGSTVTFLQRYTLKAALGLAASDDDDAKAAGSDPISTEQIETLRSLIVEVAADIPKFCKYMKVERIDDITAKDFGRAHDALVAKRSKA